MRSSLRFRQVTIVGCGLIGGSFALAFRRVEPTVLIAGWDTSTTALEDALRRRVIDKIDEELAMGGVSTSDLIYLATPVTAIIDFLTNASQHVAPGVVITDAGSTKREICRVARECLPNNLTFIGGHPIAGSEHSGVTYARADLFTGAPYIMVSEHSPRRHQLERLLLDIGARVRHMTADEHDSTLAMTSHLPQLLSTALAATVSSNSHLAEIKMVAGPGLRDMTRLANSTWSMWQDILQTNAENVAAAIDEFLDSLQKVRTELTAQQQNGLDAAAELFSRAHTFSTHLSNMKKTSNRSQP
jgi:prephenate dehydrogenase